MTYPVPCVLLAEATVRDAIVRAARRSCQEPPAGKTGKAGDLADRRDRLRASGSGYRATFENAMIAHALGDDPYQKDGLMAHIAFDSNATGERASARPTLVVVGSINRDVLIWCERLPSVGETVTGSGFADARGGKGANQAAAAAVAAGGTLDVVLIGAVGDDAEGQVELADLEQRGVDVAHVDRVPGVTTGTAFVSVDRRGANQIVVVPGANAAVSPEHVRRVVDRLRPRVVLVSLEIPHEAAEAALVAAAGVHATTILNPTPVGGLRREVLTACDVLTPNEVEFRQLANVTVTGVVDELTAPRLVERVGLPHHRTVFAITLGERGVLLVDSGSARRIAAPDVEVVDTTGAGDAFNGVLAAWLARDSDIDTAAAQAVALASRSTEARGARLTG
jgi:ribokinase